MRLPTLPRWIAGASSQDPALVDGALELRKPVGLLERRIDLAGGDVAGGCYCLAIRASTSASVAYSPWASPPPTGPGRVAPGPRPTGWSNRAANSGSRSCACRRRAGSRESPGGPARRSFHAVGLDQFLDQLVADAGVRVAHRLCSRSEPDGGPGRRGPRSRRLRARTRRRAGQLRFTSCRATRSFRALPRRLSSG